MIMKVSPDAGKIMEYRNTDGRKVIAVADSGEHQ
jgi:hypothetical protein